MRYQLKAQVHITAWQSNVIQRIIKEQLTILSGSGELIVVVNKNMYVSLWFSIGHFREVYPTCVMVSGPLIKVSLLLWYLLQMAAARLLTPCTNLKALFWFFLNPFLKVIFYIYSQVYIWSYFVSNKRQPVRSFILHLADRLGSKFGYIKLAVSHPKTHFQGQYSLMLL